MVAFRLPRLQYRLAIVDESGRPTSTFTDFINVQFAGKIEAQENSQAAVLAELQQVVSDMQATMQAVQIAQETANNAPGGAGVSGSASSPSINIPVGTAWQAGPQVDLTGVAAGTLTITGSGPLQDDDVNLSASGNTIGFYNWRVVEIDGVIETVVFTGDFTARQTATGEIASIINKSLTAVSSFTLARTNTGSISYRIDAQSSTIALNDLSLYIFARRE